MKIALIGPSHPFRGGLAHYTTLLYRNLKRYHQVKFLSFKRQYPNFLFPGKTDRDPSQVKIKEDGIEYTIDSLNPLSWFFTALKILKFRPKLLIMPWWVSFWAPHFWLISLIVKISSGTKILFICHNVKQHESNFFDKFLMKLVLKRGDFFFVHSDEEMRILKNILKKPEIRKVYHPTYAVFNFEKMDKYRARRTLNITGKVILFFGFVRAYKGLEYLIKAIPLILKEIELTLLIVGEFWKDKKFYLKLLRDLGIKNKVLIVDKYIPNEEVGIYFSAADLVVLPYISGTGSGIVQIAFGFTKPVVATKVGCLPEVVSDGKTGYLVEPKNSTAIANAVIKFFKEDRNAEFTKNLNAEKEKFSWNRMVEHIENLF